LIFLDTDITCRVEAKGLAFCNMLCVLRLCFTNDLGTCRQSEWSWVCPATVVLLMCWSVWEQWLGGCFLEV